MSTAGLPADATVAEPPAPPDDATESTDSQDRISEVLRSFVSGPVAERLVESGGQLAEERRLVTALFADLSGFTALAGRLDPEALLEIIDPVVAALTSVVGAYEGYVEKFAGDALLAFFGAPVSHEDDAERALRVALDMHAVMARWSATGVGQELTLHVGINTGHVIARVVGSEVRMDYAVLGDAVVLAQRFESVAPAGETYVGDTTKRLTDHRFEFESIGDLELKGRSTAVPAWRLLGRRDSLRWRGAGRRLVGRSAELDRALAVLAGADGPPALLVIGEPGVGKSRLVAELRTATVPGRRRWLSAAATSYGSALPYGPFTELLRSQLGIGDTEAGAEAEERLHSAMHDLDLPEVIPYLRTLLGLPDVEGSHLDPEVLRHGLREAVISWLGALARVDGLVVVIEDMHWADASSVELTATLLDRAAPGLSLLLTGRAAAAQLFTPGTFPATALELEPLDEASLEVVLTDLLQAPPSPRLAAHVVRRTAGNPFFVEEVARSLQAGGALTLAAGQIDLRHGWDDEEAPTTVEGALSARIDALPRGAVRLLQTASVIGEVVQLPLLQAVAGETLVKNAVPVLSDAHLLERLGDGEDLVFRHALVRDVAYARLLRRHRRELHRKVAAAVENYYGAGDDFVDLLARHHYLGETAQAVDMLARAGARAARLFANEEAIIHFSHAVSACEADPALSHRLPDLQLSLADLYELVGSYDDALGLYDQVRGSTVDVRAWRGSAATLRKQGRPAEALALLDTALSLPDLDEPGQAGLWLERGRTLLGAGRYHDALTPLRNGLALPAEPLVRGHLLLQLARAELGEGRAQEALGHALGAHETLSQLQDTRALTSALRTLGHTYEGLGKLDEAAEALGQGLALAERAGIVEEVGACLINLGLVDLRRGRLDEAIAADRRAIVEFGRVGHLGGLATAYANLAEKTLAAGNPAEALEHCDRALALGEEIDDSLTVADASLTRSAILLALDRAAEAAVTAERAAAMFSAIGAAPFTRQAWDVASSAYEQLGDTRRAEHAREAALAAGE